MVLGDPHPTPVTSLVDQGVDDKTIDNVQRNVELPLWTPTGGALELEQRWIERIKSTDVVLFVTGLLQ